MHERLAPLRPAERDLLLRAAAVGRRFDVALLAELTGLTARRVRAALRAASNLQLVEPVPGAPSCYEFRHALTRDAMYGELVAVELRPLHRAIGAALERLSAHRPADLDQLAYHWWAAGDTDRGARYNEAAGDRAGSLHAYDDAVSAYRRALDVLPRRSATRVRIEAKMAGLRTAVHEGG